MKTYQFCRRQLALGLGFLFMALLLSMNQVQQQREALAQRIAPSLLRFHILANSDSSADQQVKLEVRSLILDYIQELLPPEQGKKKTIRCLREQKAAIEKTASQYLAQRGYPYGAELEITRCYFPTRVYDNMVIPCGEYDAARITLGKGKGHNWWWRPVSPVLLCGCRLQGNPQGKQKPASESNKSGRLSRPGESSS